MGKRIEIRLFDLFSMKITFSQLYGAAGSFANESNCRGFFFRMRFFSQLSISSCYVQNASTFLSFFFLYLNCSEKLFPFLICHLLKNLVNKCCPVHDTCTIVYTDEHHIRFNIFITGTVSATKQPIVESKKKKCGQQQQLRKETHFMEKT